MLCLNGLLVAGASALEGTVKGRALDAASGQPIETMEVQLVGRDAQLLRIRDDEVALLFPRVPAGVYEPSLNHVWAHLEAEPTVATGRASKSTGESNRRLGTSASRGSPIRASVSP
jgi:hypothetical protein